LVRGFLRDDTVDANISGDAIVIDSNVMIPIISIPLIIILFIIMIKLRKRKGELLDEEEDSID